MRYYQSQGIVRWGSRDRARKRPVALSAPLKKEACRLVSTPHRSRLSSRPLRVACLLVRLTNPSRLAAPRAHRRGLPTCAHSSRARTPKWSFQRSLGHAPTSERSVHLGEVCPLAQSPRASPITTRPWPRRQLKPKNPAHLPAQGSGEFQRPPLITLAPSHPGLLPSPLAPPGLRQPHSPRPRRRDPFLTQFRRMD